MNPFSCPSRGALPDGTYVELVGSLCSTRLPAVIMTGLFAIVGTLATARSGDPLLLATLVIGSVASVARLAILFAGRRAVDRDAMSFAAAKRFERAFAAAYIAFAAIFGGFAARAVMLPMPQMHMPIGILVVGYAAGVATTVALRPRIAVASLLLAVMPMSAALAWSGSVEGSVEDAVSSVCLTALLAGSLRSIEQRYRSQAAKTTKRQAFAELARRDHLTGLDNRLALAEAFGALEQAGIAGEDVVLHYIDLDDFKPVNDQHGHLAGDMLLCAVAQRLRSEQGAGDIVARLSGDEFVFVQIDAPTAAHAAAKAERLETVLSTPFRVDGESVAVGASVGSSGAATPGFDLELMLRRADMALRARKIERKTAHGPRPDAGRLVRAA